MKHLISPSEVRELSRPCYADDEIIQICIEEAELLDIKSALGDTLFVRILQNRDTDNLGILIEGGSYYDRCGNKKMFAGLKKATAYYAYARVVKNGNAVQTRFGHVIKSDDYSEPSDLKNRLQAYNDAFSVADQYLKECLNYLIANKLLFPEYKGFGRIKNNRVIFKKIGD